MTKKGRQKSENVDFLDDKRKFWDLPCPGHPRTSLAPGIQEPLQSARHCSGKHLVHRRPCTLAVLVNSFSLEMRFTNA